MPLGGVGARASDAVASAKLLGTGGGAMRRLRGVFASGEAVLALAFRSTTTVRSSSSGPRCVGNLWIGGIHRSRYTSTVSSSATSEEVLARW